MDLIDALWYGAVTPGEVLEKQDEKQKALVKLAGNQAELRDYEARLVFRSGFRLGMQLAAEALTNRPELYEE